LSDLVPGKLAQYRRIVVKIGSSLLTTGESELNRPWLSSLVEDLARLAKDGHQLMVVSSGAIALGRRSMQSTRPELLEGLLRLNQSQAAASIGQILLSSAYDQLLSEYGLKAAQILLTIGDTEIRRQYLNAKATIGTLLKWSAIPIINENDTVATDVIRYGDNDRLAARVASMMDADLLILLSDVEGLYAEPPDVNPDAELLAEVSDITPEILAMAGDAASIHSRGGMKTKIEAARIATEAGSAMVIASGRELHSLRRLDQNGPGTWFTANPATRNAKKQWIAGGLHLPGKISIDNGAFLALESGNSLLAAGITKVSGDFERGDSVEVIGPNGHVLGRGLIEYDSAEARLIVGLKTAEIMQRLGPNIRAALIRRENLVLKVENLIGF